MSNLEELQNEERREKENYKDQIEDLKAKCQEKQEIVNRSSDNFMMFKNDVAKQAINSRSGKPISPKDLEQYQMLELKKEQEVMQVRLENIKLKNRLKKREMQLKAKEELAEGLHLIDFEQLKIENQTYNEKIEERNEELLKLRKKITTTVQVLTHLKEKLQFVQAENSEQRSNLRTVEAHAAQKRDILTRTKQVRDALRIENVKLRQKCGLLGNEPLLRDYEQRKEQSDELRAKIERLKMDHAELTMNCSGVRTKIEGARQEEKPL